MVFYWESDITCGTDSARLRRDTQTEQGEQGDASRRPGAHALVLGEVPPQAAVLVPDHEIGSAPAGAALRVDHADLVGDDHARAAGAHAPAQIEVFGMQEIAFVETAHALEHGARQQHQGTRHRIDVAQRDDVLARQVVDVMPALVSHADTAQVELFIGAFRGHCVPRLQQRAAAH